MNWRWVIVGLVVTLVGTLIGAAIDRAVPTYDDGKLPGWVTALVVGVALSFAAGWWIK